MTDSTYIGLADTAKMLRKALAKSFPGVKFYVRSESYAGGASIDVYYDGLDRYDDGPDMGTVYRKRTAVYKPGMPTRADVENVTNGFAGRGFDGMIDMGFSIDSYMDADGNVAATGSSGTGGSRGSVPAWGPDADAGLTKVRFGASFVFVNDTLPYDVRKAA